MNGAKQVIDFRTSKGFSKAQSDEHLRVRSDNSRKHALATGNYDLTREHLNFEITKGGKIQPVDKTRSIPERIAANLAARGIKRPGASQSESQQILQLVVSRIQMRDLKNLGSEQW